jgi:LuxR family maltose regulon positive regulatory protein
MITEKHPQLLATKILPPRSAPGLIRRERLLGLIDEVQTKRLTLIRAAAGFGKTSLAAAWAERLQERGHWVAWLSLDIDDDEPTRFLFYVAHVLRRACNGLGEPAIGLIEEIFLARPNTIVSTLINDLTEIDEEVYLFLDDYHCISHRGIHEGMAFLLRNAPSNFHLVIATRSEPPLPLGRCRAQNELLEVEVSALRFDLDEIREFLEQEGLGRLDPSDLNALHAKTEGWPAVMRIVASTSSQSGLDLGQYVRGLTGALRPIGAYLSEMLDGLPAEMVQFMLRTSILDRLSAPLCQALTDLKLSQQMLDAIVDRQLMLLPLDQEGRGFRFHPLVRAYLAKQLDARLAEEVPELHRRAYRWYAGQELWTDAVHHATVVGDNAQAVVWIENCAMELVKRGDLLPLLSWQRLLPAELTRAEVKVRVAIAWGMALAMRFEEALQLVAEVEQDIGDEDTSKNRLARCECQTIRAVVVAVQDDSASALVLAETVLARQPTDPWIANVASNVARFGYWKAGDLGAFYATPWMPCSDEENRRNVFAAVYRLCLQGLVDLQQLRFADAERLYLEALRAAERHAGPNSVCAALPASLLAQIRYDQGRLEEAEDLVVDRLSIIDEGGILDCVLRVYLVLARIAVRRMNIDRAHALLEQAETLGQVRHWDRLVAVVLAERIGLQAAAGRMTEARAHLARLERLALDRPAPTRSAWSDIHDYVALAQAHVAWAENRLADCIAILRSRRELALKEQRDYFALRLGAPLAVACWRANETAEALSLLQQTLKLTGSASMYQPILDAGPDLFNLLLRFREAARAGAARDLLPFADELIARCREGHAAEPTDTRASAIAEALSPRELRVLELIGQGQSNKDIARTLSIAPETVKSHVKNIFMKLSVERRAQAVTRALSLGLVRTV